MAKFLLLKHYRGAPAAVNNIPMDQWKPDEVDTKVPRREAVAAYLHEKTAISGSRPPSMPTPLATHPTSPNATTRRVRPHDSTRGCNSEAELGAAVEGRPRQDSNLRHTV
jgi:hypothetical protein